MFDPDNSLRARNFDFCRKLLEVTHSKVIHIIQELNENEFGRFGNFIKQKCHKGAAIPSLVSAGWCISLLLY